MIFVTRKRSSIEMHVSRKAESIRRLFWLDYPGTVWRMKQRNLFYCRAVFFVSAYALHTVLRVPSCLRLEGIFVCPNFFGKQEQFAFLVLFLLRRERKIKVFYSEGLKTRGCFVYGKGYPILQKKLNTFFDNMGVFWPPFVQRRWRAFALRDPWQLNDRPNGIWLCHDAERPSEATLRREPPGQAYKQNNRVKRQIPFFNNWPHFYLFHI